MPKHGCGQKIGIVINFEIDHALLQRVYGLFAGIRGGALENSSK